MKVTVLLFARPRDVVGAARVALDLVEGSTVAAAFDQLAGDHPGLVSMRPSLGCAVDQEYAGWDTPLHDDAEVALIPPTAGG